MEQDIKILKELKETLQEDMSFIEKQNKTFYKSLITKYKTRIEAIENLIKAYKELEEENRYFKTHIIYPEIIKLNFIPVSLVEEKLEELDNMIIEISKGNLQKYTVGEIFLAKKILEELLERRK